MSDLLLRPRVRVDGAAPTAATTSSTSRVVTDGKHLAVDGRRFRLRGVTYGSFRARHDGALFPATSRIAADFDAMVAAGLNTVRTYTAPPADLLDAAAERGLRLIVGVDYRDWRFQGRATSASHRQVLAAGSDAIEGAMARCAGRPEVLAVSVGNEVPPDVVRVHGIGAVTDTLGALAGLVHRADPAALVTYTSFPTTEYLEVDGLDLASFNVFLESADDFERYVRHLMCVTGPRPLVITELGLPGESHGVAAQADLLDRQLRTVDETGCAGATVFAWTDEWGVDGTSVDGWGFGITDAERRPKPAVEAVSAWARRPMVDARPRWPSMSVVVCAYNEERTIEACLASLAACAYPELEVVVCDDGSIDATLELARRSPFRVLALPHGGLSAARNAGIQATQGELVAFLDADATCDPDWPWHLALAFDAPGVVAAGGPNLPVPNAQFVERAVARSPGAPTEVLVSDDRAEHVPGCNMAFRRPAIAAIGGFDPVYRSAGDDVDVCWKLLDNGGEIAFAPAAQIWHHRRATVRGYLRQQRGYGRAEKLLSGAHPHRFNRLGQAMWSGWIYGGARLLPSLLRPVVYHGSQGHAPFQPVASRRAELAANWASAIVPLLVLLAFGGAAATVVNPWWLLVPAAISVLLVAYAVAIGIAARVDRGERRRRRLRALVGVLHVAQPLARTWGRLMSRRAAAASTDHVPWRGDRTDWLHQLARGLRRRGAIVRIADRHSPWDLQAAYGPFARARMSTAVVWNWQPQWRLRVAPRLPALVVVAGGAALAGFSVVAAGLAVVVALAAVVFSMLRVRHLALETLGETTRVDAPRLAPIVNNVSATPVMAWTPGDGRDRPAAEDRQVSNT